MRRSVERLSDEAFDVLVIGGGAAGAAAAREACLRGFTTALIEKEDFGAGSSAHCFKVVHGGIRYVQHADVKRMRSSCRERSTFLRIAPHLVSPMSFVIPTYGQGKNSKWFLGTGMSVYDALTTDCNAEVADPARRIRRTKFLSKSETLQLFPEVPAERLTGAAIFQDGQMYNPPRLVLGFAAAADEMGAAVANYVEAEKLIVEDSRVVGVTALDRLGGNRLNIRARMVVNAAGPWAEGVLGSVQDRVKLPAGTYSRDACFMVARKSTSHMALAVQGLVKDNDAVLARNARHLFLVPWRDCTLVGVWHKVVPREPDSVGISWNELREFIAEFNQCYPALQLSESEVRTADFGLVPFGEASKQQGGLSFGKSSTLVDHAATHKLPGLVSVISVRYTVARRDAVAALNVVEKHLGKRSALGDSEVKPLPGGDIDDFTGFTRSFHAKRPSWLSAAAGEQLVRNYGTRAASIVALGEQDANLRQTLDGSTVSLAEVAHAVREEMSPCMTDILFRRTELGTAGHPGEAALEELQNFLRTELNWSERRVAQERAAVDRHFERYLATPPARRTVLARSA